MPCQLSNLHLHRISTCILTRHKGAGTETQTHSRGGGRGGVAAAALGNFPCNKLCSAEARSCGKGTNRQRAQMHTVEALGKLTAFPQ